MPGPFALTRIAHAAGTRLPTHAHAQATLLVVMRGRLTETVGTRSYPLKDGSVLFKPAGTPHSDKCETAIECLSIESPPELHGVLRGVVAEPISRAWSINLVRETQTHGPGWQLIVEGLIWQAFGELARIEALAASRPTWLDDVLAMARQQRTLGDIAAAVGRHPSHVAREFQRHEGVAVGEFARRVRLELAAAALRDGRAIAEVAQAAGFYDQSHFTAAFRRVFRITPGAYRRLAVTKSSPLAS
jgi:AraC family transcriptional regulator